MLCYFEGNIRNLESAHNDFFFKNVRLLQTWCKVCLIDDENDDSVVLKSLS